MELSSQTLQVLNNFASVNSNIVITTGNVLRTVSESKTILARATIDEEFPKGFGIYELNEFLSALSLVESPRISFGENNMDISDGTGRSSIKYFYSDPSILTTTSNEIVMPEAQVKFKLDRDTMNRIKKAASVLGHTEVSVRNVDGVIVLTVADNENSTSNAIDIAVDGESTSDDFKYVFNIANLKMMEGDYDVSLSSKLISHFVNTESNVEYWVALQKTSKV
jgi:hypothetical protein